MDPGIVSFSAKVYRWMLQAYPHGFRTQYSAPMAQIFRDCCFDAIRTEGLRGVLLLWLRTLLDYGKTMIEQYSNGGIQMTRERFYRFSGWCFIAGSLAFLIGGLASNRPQYNPYNAAALPIDRLANDVGWPALMVGQVLITIGLAGLLIHFGARSQFAKIGAGIGILGGIVGFTGFVAGSLPEPNPAWYLFMYGTGVQFLGLTIFGIGALQQHLLPGVSGLPLLAGIWFPTFILVALIYEAFTGKWLEISGFFQLLLMGTTVLGLTLLGLRMQAKDLIAGGVASGM